jgi:hypothetical protein
MDGLTLLNEARAAGLEVRTDGDRLVVRGPRSAETLARQLLAHKAELLYLLTLIPTDYTPRALDPVGPCEAPIVAVKVWSDVLQQAIWVVADDLPCDEWPTDAPVYTRAEVKVLTRVGPDTVEWVHVTKQMFNARVVDRHATPIVYEEHRRRGAVGRGRARENPCREG